MHFYRPTWAQINLANLAYNFEQIRKILSPDTKIMVCVKSDAYGHGLVTISRKLASCAVDYLGVASIDEGIKLRQANIKLPVLVLGAILKKDISPLFKYKLMPSVCSEDLAFSLNKKGRSLGKAMGIHIKVDTGMGRFGILHNHAFELIKNIHKLKFIKIEGVFTHLACADINYDFTVHQICLFNQLIEKLNRHGIHIPLVHAANSLGVINYKQSHFNMVRPGLIVYGLYPKEDLHRSQAGSRNMREKIKLKPVLSLKTRIVFFKRVPKGFGISYGHTYFTKKDTTIVTLPIGYGDGYPRMLSGKAPVLIKGRRFQISGTICMDQITVDVGNLAVKLGDEAVLIGSQGKNIITSEELANLCDTIPYEIVCGLSSRIPRVYI